MLLFWIITPTRDKYLKLFSSATSFSFLFDLYTFLSLVKYLGNIQKKKKICCCVLSGQRATEKNVGFENFNYY